ncbi:putative leucine-rich repeat receptor-like serine/threonine-protein kinase [Dorcoceras hygrometricum]|uniref:non-specific serine/threonine protein kinase n=1 Tax=Dorcoceras hygrometricum TaxID=472368 RepID=A0A2Z7CGJ1_9LAMI|nr:putative leucine-rich repeat receptor-like serine/threonine-protein kinase [Dorcoceras hygrometricum]
MLIPRFLAFIVLFVIASEAAVLPSDEVESLKLIGRTLGKTDWDFTVDPCSGESGWRGNGNAVNCTCTFENNTVCHVVAIVWKSQNLDGRLPPELVRLPFLQEIDLSRNYLNGSIPPEWGSTKLVHISLLGNRLTGSIPEQLANISMLTDLVLEANQFSGTIPPQFGNLSLLDRLLLSSNNLTGEIPNTLAKLTRLRDFDNNFRGSIPDFIEKWTNIEILAIQASGLSGPIPSGISSLTKLTDLRISDLNGDASTFPLLNNSIGLDTLILRSCNIVGELPDYLGEMKNLDVLDLSFNNLSGPIPASFSGLVKTDFIYLTGNSLNGPLPDWMLRTGENIDLSYNNLTSESSASSCQSRGSLNLFASSKGNTSGFVSCLRSISCEPNYYSLHINCGGREVDDDNGATYEEDLNSGGASNFFVSRTNWASSSTGHFLNDDISTDTYTLRNTSRISGQDAKLYMSARISPLSLTYYGFCLINGNYTVDLHFAEIRITDDRTYNSLGRRIFDVYIQGIRVLKDFNIEDKAGGANKGIKENFTAIVTDNTLDIQFHWAGKGTTALPARGVYGPLISAISVTPDFDPPSSGKSISAGAIAGIAIAVLFIGSLIFGLLWWKGCFEHRDTLEYELKGVDLNTGSFTLRQIKAATNNFDPANKIGEGGFGPVYKGSLSDGTIIAVKQLSSKSKQGNREFINEIGMISALQHPHLVKLYGCCIEGNQLLLVYEFLENNSLARALFGREEHRLKLDWPTRHKICIGIARGLAYLHEESRLKIVHRDIKATNVLLDKNLNPKISDFGLAKLDEEDNTHISTRIAGTFGYMAPEYAMRGYLTDKADVYSFGIVLLEIVSGRSNTGLRPKEEPFYLLDWAHQLRENGDLMELVDPRLESSFNKKEVITTINVAFHCTNSVAAERPTMSAVVSILEGRNGLREFVSDSSTFWMNRASRKDTNGSSNDVPMTKIEHSQSISMDVPWTNSSTSNSDLYPLTLDTDHWESR